MSLPAASALSRADSLGMVAHSRSISSTRRAGPQPVDRRVLADEEFSLHVFEPVQGVLDCV
jgi:hypothetical protein